MKKEDLLELGLDETQIKEVFKLNGIAVEKVKTQLTEAKNEKATLETELTELKKTMVSEADLEALKTEKAELETKLNEALEESTRKIDEITYNHLLDSSLKSAGVRDDVAIKAIKAIMNKEGIALKEGKLDGLDTELERLKTEAGYLFQTDEPKGGPMFTTKSQDKIKTSTDPLAMMIAK